VSKKKTKPKRVNRRAKRAKYIALVVILAATLSLGAVFGQWRNLPVVRNLVSPAPRVIQPAPPPTIPSAANPSKEYIYAGGKLIATESGKSDQTITFNSIPDKTYGVLPFLMSGTASSELPITYTVTSGPASFSGNIITINGAGAVSVTASQSGNDGFNPAQPVTQSFNVAKAAVTVTLTDLTQTYDSAAHYASVTTTPANLNVILGYNQGGTTVNSPTNAGSYSVTATVNENNYQGNATGTLVINKATASISLTNLTPTYDGAAHYASVTTNPANLSVTLVYSQNGNNVSSPTNAGSYTVNATVNENNYQGNGTGTLVINKTSQSITFNTLAGKTYGDSDFTVSASASSALATSFSILSGSPATISGTTVHITGLGSVTVRASQAGDGNYNAAPNVDQIFTVNKANQTITFSALTNKTYGNAPFTVSATGGGSGNPVTFSASGYCTTGGINGSTITITGAGSCTVTAAQAADSNYNAATAVPQSFTIGKATATIAVNGSTGTYDGNAHGATGSASGVASENLNSLLTLGASFTNVPGGTANWSFAGNANYSAASGSATITINKATPTISWNNPADIVYGTALSSTQLNATPSYGGNSVAGTFAYSPVTGTVLSAGDNTLFTTFTPTDSVDFNTPPSPSAHINVSPTCAGATGHVYQRTITIDYTKVSGTNQTNFPVLISGTYSYLATASNGGYVQNANGYDIVFYSDAARTTKLDHEIQKYVAATGEIEMWVLIPSLSHTADTVFYMVYGDNAITTSQENKTGVWDANFRGVWHLGDGTTLSAKDSTSNAKDGTIHGATAGTGQIGGSASFNGSSQNITTPASIDLDDAFTLSAWINLDDVAHNTYAIFGLGLNNSDNYGFLVSRPDHSGLTLQSTNQGYPPGASFTTPSQNISAASWTYVVLKKTAGSTIKILQNGTEITNEAMRDTGYTAGTLSIGSATAANYFKGKIDEARFSTVERSDDWVKTEYNNQSAPSAFYTISSSGGGCFASQRSITIDYTKVPNSNQSSFPVLISGTYSYLAGASNGGRVQSANGYDIVFYSDAARTTKLDHEIQKYVAATGEIEMWVRIPTLLYTSDTVFYMAYGDNAISTSQENKTGVWDANFRGVWHLGDGTTLSAKDSTSNSKDGTINGATASTGQIGGSASFSGSSQNITTPANIDLDDAFTVSAWINLDDVTHNTYVVFGFGYNNSDNYGFLIPRPDHSGLTLQSTNQGWPPGASFTTPSQNISATTWTYVVLKKAAGSTVKIFQNGTLITNEAMRDTGYMAGTLSIGSATGACYFKGKIDEARFSTVERSDDWVKTEYNNQSSPSTFYTIGSGP